MLSGSKTSHKSSGSSLSLSRITYEDILSNRSWSISWTKLGNSNKLIKSVSQTRLSEHPSCECDLLSYSDSSRTYISAAPLCTHFYRFVSADGDLTSSCLGWVGSLSCPYFEQTQGWLVIAAPLYRVWVMVWLKHRHFTLVIHRAKSQKFWCLKSSSCQLSCSCSTASCICQCWNSEFSHRILIRWAKECHQAFVQQTG